MQLGSWSKNCKETFKDHDEVFLVHVPKDYRKWMRRAEDMVRRHALEEKEKKRLLSLDLIEEKPDSLAMIADGKADSPNQTPQKQKPTKKDDTPPQQRAKMRRSDSVDSFVP